MIRLNDYEKEMITPFIVLDRELQRSIANDVSQEFIANFKRKVTVDDMLSAFRRFEIDILVEPDCFSLVSNDKLFSAVSHFLAKV